MTIDELIDRKLVFIAGKGGVGKSTIAAALALAAARKGTSVCIVESDGQEQMSQLFQTDPVGYDGRSLAPNITGISITTEGALREYVTKRLPLSKISQHFINNRLVRYFLDATPGLKELLTLGKITDMIDGSEHDLFIVDMPATGHGKAMLDVPGVVMNAVHAGPLFNQAEQTNRAINDPSVSAICFVTLAEELATAETIELYQSIRKTMTISIGPVIANGVHLPLIKADYKKRYAELKRKWGKKPETALLIEGAELANARADLNKDYLSKLDEAFGFAPVVVPFLFLEAIEREGLSQIADYLSAGGTR